jgi:uncharacterized Tic20 family protein
MDETPPILPTVEAAPGVPGKEERMWAMIAHFSAYSGHIIPFGHIIGPMIIWLLKKDQFPFVADQGKEALNAQISFTIYFIAAGILCYFCIGFFVLPVVWLADIILVVIAGIKANEGIKYRYPAIFRLV